MGNGADLSAQRVAALYDIHGNLPALRAVLLDVAKYRPDLIVVGGDVVPGPNAHEVLAVLRDGNTPVRWIMGNGEDEILQAIDRGIPAINRSENEEIAAWTASTLSDLDVELIRSFEPEVLIDIRGLGQALFCHGSPRSNEEMITALTSKDRLGEILEGVDEPLVVCGHTHRQFILPAPGTTVVNAGAVGMPYEGKAVAFWLAIGPTIEHRLSEYDIDAGLNEMRQSGFPGFDEMFKESLIEPTDRDTVARYFEDAALARAAEPSQ